MLYSTQLLALMAMSLPEPAKTTKKPQPTGPREQNLREALKPAFEQVVDLLTKFREEPVTPARTHELEKKVQEQLREVGRRGVEWTYNHIEPTDPRELPQHVQFEILSYTRCNRKTPQDAWTLFGPIRLWRAGYRPTEKTGDSMIFPLVMALGLIRGASPALADHSSRLMAQTGMTQSLVLTRLQEENGVGWGVAKLRQVSQVVSEKLSEHRQEVQVEKVLVWMKKAEESRGRHKPGLSAGRDGITMHIRAKGGKIPEVASTGTLSVLDRRGKRLGTVYLAYTPEAGQGTMTAKLTALLTAVLLRWQGTEFRLSYVTDAGDNETAYYEKVLAAMTHPRTGKALEWKRVVDYYHASTRIWDMAKLLFGDGQGVHQWARKMLKWLKMPGGVNRVLHSAVVFRDRAGLKGKPLSEFEVAYRYLRDRMEYMRYDEYRRLGVPLGSGVTEAACKTVYTQRLKLSGMVWKKPGAQTILNVRVLLLSGVWDAAVARVLNDVSQPKVRGQVLSSGKRSKKAG